MMNASDFGQQALSLSDKEFKMFRELIFDRSGINLHEGKKELLRTRLGKKMRQIGTRSFKEYFERIRADKTGRELMDLLDAISTNLTSFFREINHFNFLEEVVIPEIKARKAGGADREARAWSAGCSSGEEPYSLAFTLEENFGSGGPPFRILATDISIEMLGRAANGVYDGEKVKSLPKRILTRHFQKGPRGNTSGLKIHPEIRKRIHFKRFNLMTPVFPFRKKFDFIFCRNVMIYFDKPTQARLVSKFYDVLGAGGYLFIGHSESLTGIEHKFRYVRPTIYMRQR